MDDLIYIIQGIQSKYIGKYKNKLSFALPILHHKLHHSNVNLMYIRHVLNNGLNSQNMGFDLGINIDKAQIYSVDTSTTTILSQRFGLD